MIRERKKRRRVPELNTTSTADISFMLLTFFLVTTSIDTDRGLAAQLPPPSTEQTHRDTEVARRNVLHVVIGPTDSIMVNGEATPLGSLRARVREFVDNPSASPAMAEKRQAHVPLLGQCAVSDAHVIFIDTSRDASYEAYFGVQDAIAQAYADLRNRLGRQRFGHGYAECNAEQRQALRTCYPYRVSEAPTEQEGGGR